MYVVRPGVAYDFVTAVYQVEENPPGGETTARLWEKIIRMSAVRGPIPEPTSDQPAGGTDEAEDDS